MGMSISHSEKSRATIKGMQETGATKVKISPRSATIVERYLILLITIGLPLVLY
jgi:hypothetical protein